MPLIYERDLEVALILALVEVHEKGPGVPAPALSLESLTIEDKGEDDAVNWVIAKKMFSDPPWLGATDFGRSMYYADTLLFIDVAGRGVFSVRNPLDSPGSLHSKWSTPWPWVIASESGGVRATPIGRNAFVVADRVPGTYHQPNYDSRTNTLAVTFSNELVHFDGSEKVFAKDGRELHRDGGRLLLRYQPVRHAMVKTQEIQGVFDSFPVFSRVAQLLAIYSTLRQALTGHREEFIGTPLWNSLLRRRSSFIYDYENRGREFEYVINH